jgi:hypothetical protein
VCGECCVCVERGVCVCCVWVCVCVGVERGECCVCVVCGECCVCVCVVGCLCVVILSSFFPSYPNKYLLFYFLRSNIIDIKLPSLFYRILR